MSQVTCVHVVTRCTAQNARQRKRLHMPARGDVPVAQPLASVEQAEQRAMASVVTWPEPVCRLQAQVGLKRCQLLAGFAFAGAGASLAV